MAERRAVLSSILWAAVPLFGLALGALVTYVLWPLSVTGTTFFDLATKAGRAEIHVIYLLAWIALTALVSLAGAALGLQGSRSSSSTIAGGALLGFGIVVGHLWLGGLLVGTTMFSIVGTDDPGRPVSPVFALAAAGWAGIVLGFVLLGGRGRHGTEPGFPRGGQGTQ